MTKLNLTDKELFYLRYLVNIHGGTEEFETAEEKNETLKLVEKLCKKLGVQ